eukprot:CAMPEP_0201474838 /NCGR_PEP_ID=MMETSP0151_2-20130828/301_1 /ASSEMBLY_ACC=CAM_ASM_000257 /TAXON_ID=200890 /ORGANISM="Paramoeba atlantica, Strain 621/1 / CCAP 1560/9" /LENGTH=145 /DNA_ID=CAMNT_0047854749 /DNA_START=83 /DNA_END=520 /DNA_ORIENTATION=-
MAELPDSQSTHATSTKTVANKNPWKHKTCACIQGCIGNPLQGCFTCFCPCVTFGIDYQRMGLGSCFMGGVAFWCYGGGAFAPVRLRGLIREKYSINGTDAEDCVTYACCPCCARFQESSELDIQMGDPANPFECVPLCMSEFTSE